MLSLFRRNGAAVLAPVFAGLVVGSIGGNAEAITLGQLQTTGGYIDSLDGSVRFSNWTVAAGGSWAGEYAEINSVSPTLNGFALDTAHSCLDPVGQAPGCVLEQIDGSFGPGGDDPLIISFLIEGQVDDIVGLTLFGTSGLRGFADEYRGYPIYPERETRADVQIDFGFGELAFARGCAVPGCGGLEDYFEATDFSEHASIAVQMTAQVMSALYFSDETPFGSPYYWDWGTTAQINSIQLGVEVVPEPSTAVLLLLGLLLMKKPASSRSERTQ